jgi:hypothetical protein
MQYQEGRWAAYHHMLQQKVKLLNRQLHLPMTADLELARTWWTVQVVNCTLPPCHMLATCPLKMEEALSSTLLVRTYQTKDCCIPEGSVIDTHHCESPRSRKWVITCILCTWRTARVGVSVLWGTEGSDFILWKIPSCDFLCLSIVAISSWLYQCVHLHGILLIYFDVIWVD